MKAYKLYYDCNDENTEKYFSNTKKALKYAKTEGLEDLLNDMNLQEWEETPDTLRMTFQQDADDLINIQYWIPDSESIYPYETAHIVEINVM